MWVCVCLCSSLSCLTGRPSWCFVFVLKCLCDPATLCPYSSAICTGGQRSHGPALSCCFAVSAKPQHDVRRNVHALLPTVVTLAINSKLTQLMLGTQTQIQHKLVWFTTFGSLSNRTAGQAPAVLPTLHKHHQVGFWFDHPSIFPGLDFDCSSLPSCALEPVPLST